MRIFDVEELDIDKHDISVLSFDQENLSADLSCS